MFSLSPYYHRLLCSVYRAFGVDDGNGHCVDAYRSPSSEQRQAAQFFEGLITDPTRSLSYQVPEKDARGNLTGRTAQVTTTVSRLMVLGDDWQDTRRNLEAIMSRVYNDGFATLTPQDAATQNTLLRGGNPLVTQQTRDPMFANPTANGGILHYPIINGAQRGADPYYPTDPRLIPDWWPQVRQNRHVWYTPVIFDRTRVPTERLRSLYEQLILAINAYLKSRNAPLAWHPLSVVCRGPMFPDAYAYNSFNPGYEAFIQDLRDHNNDPRFWVRQTILGWQASKDINSVSFFPPYDANWLRSLEYRIPISWDRGQVALSRGSLDDYDSSIRTWYTYHADATLELLRWMNFAQFLLDSGDTTVNEAKQQDARSVMLDVFAVQQLYAGVQDIAYRHVGARRGDNVIGYRQRMEAEIQARKNQARSQLIRSAGVEGYTSSGDDGADIASATIGTVGLAFADAVRTGNIAAGVVSALVRGLTLLIGFLTMPEAPTNPFSRDMRVGSSDLRYGSPIYGMSPAFALEAPPCFRVR